MSWGKDTYQSGRPWGICDRCGFKKRHDQLRKEWTEFLVCSDCFDPKPADMTPPVIKPEGLPIRDPRPEPDAVESVEAATPEWEDLPGGGTTDTPDDIVSTPDALYIPAVVLKGLQAVADLSDLGDDLTPDKTPAANAAALLALAAGNAIDGTVIYLRPGTYEDWDFSGYTVYDDRTGTHAYTRCKFGPPTPATLGTYVPALGIGLNDTPLTPAYLPVVILTDCLFDMTCTGWNAPAIAQQTGRLIVRSTRFKNGSGTYITASSLAGGTVFDCQGCAFDSPAMNPSSVDGESHCENIVFSGGSGIISGNLMSCDDGTNTLAYVMTGAMLIQAQAAAVTATVSGNVIHGFASIYSPTDMQIGEGAYATAVTLTNNVMQGGTGLTSPGKYVITGANATLTASGNVAYPLGGSIL